MYPRGFKIPALIFVVFIIIFPGNFSQGEATMSFILKSAAFDNGKEIPLKYTCQGENISPPLTWENVPANTRSLVLIVDDPDAPDPKAPKMTWVHWVLYNIPPDADSLSENIHSSRLPKGTKQGLNGWRKKGYGGPCPPIGRHRYFHKLYALDTILKNLENPTKARVEAAMKGHIIARAELVGTYEKTGN